MFLTVDHELGLGGSSCVYRTAAQLPQPSRSTRDHYPLVCLPTFSIRPAISFTPHRSSQATVTINDDDTSPFAVGFLNSTAIHAAEVSMHFRTHLVAFSQVLCFSTTGWLHRYCSRQGRAWHLCCETDYMLAIALIVLLCWSLCSYRCTTFVPRLLIACCRSRLAFTGPLHH